MQETTQFCAHHNFVWRKEAVKFKIFTCFGQTPINQCGGCEMIDRFD